MIRRELQWRNHFIGVKPCNLPNIAEKAEQNTEGAGPPRALRGPGSKLENEFPCERNEQRIFLITPFRLA